MERKANFPPPPASNNPNRPVTTGDTNLTTSTSSSSSLSPPDFLRHVHAVFKRHRPIGIMQSNVSRARRVLVSQTEPSKSTTPISSIPSNNNGKTLSQIGPLVGSEKLVTATFDQREDNAAEVGTNHLEDSLLTLPSTMGTVTTLREEHMNPFSMQRGDELIDRHKASLAVLSSHISSPLVSPDDGLKDWVLSAGIASSACQGADARLTTDTRMDDISSYLHSLALTEGGDNLGNQAAIIDQDPKLLGLQNMDVCDISMKSDGARFLEKTSDPRHDQHFVDPMTRSSVVGSSCATTMSVHSGPTFQCTHAAMGVDGHQDHQKALHFGESIKEKRVPGDVSTLQSQVPLMNKREPSQTSKAEKVPRKKKYDPDVFFKVNGKLYQKLGKIGSGGSSEVHKVISSDCTIYALKKIKLKGRDYPTAYGFCQEIEYLNKLKGKDNIIQLIDYEVTDKALLQEVMNGFMSIKDGRIKDDGYIYMVLEYGEVDLAHMLSQKWKEMDNSSWKIDENWLRFYWQQMLEAVNTIHEERIVHSDLKPANFLLVKGSLKLIDFGIAKAILSDTTNIQRDAQVGTLNYMSPEAFMWNEQDAKGNTIKCGRPSDIWSLGCILFQMVYGKTPFAQYKTFWSKFKVITDRNHEIMYEQVSNPWLIDLMRRCLAWDRDERWRIPQLLQHPFLVPPVRPELPLSQDHPCKLLMHRVEIYWDDPEVSRLCSKLHEVVANLEKGQTDPSIQG